MKVVAKLWLYKWAVLMALVVIAFAAFYTYSSAEQKKEEKEQSQADVQNYLEIGVMSLLMDLNQRLQFMEDDLLSWESPPQGQDDFLESTKYLLNVNSFLDGINYIGADGRVEFAAPLEGNEEMIGAEPAAVRVEAMALAASSGKVQLSAPFEIGPTQYGYSLIVPRTDGSFYEMLFKARGIFGPNRSFPGWGYLSVQVLDGSDVVYTSSGLPDRLDDEDEYRAEVSGVVQGRDVHVEVLPAMSMSTSVSDFWPTFTLAGLVCSLLLLLAMIVMQTREIGLRRRSENALKDSEQRFRSLIENAADVIMIMGEGGEIRYISPSVEPVLGYKPEEVISSEPNSYVNPDDLAEVMDKYSEAISVPSNLVEIPEMRVLHRDGSERVLSIITHNLLHDPCVDGIVFNYRDITERKRAEEELLLLSNAVRMSADSIIVTDTDGAILDANEASSKVYGVADKVDLVGKRPFDFVGLKMRKTFPRC